MCVWCQAHNDRFYLCFEYVCRDVWRASVYDVYELCGALIPTKGAKFEVNADAMLIYYTCRRW